MKPRIAIAALVAAAAIGGTGAGFALAGGPSTAASHGTPSASSSAKPAPGPSPADAARLAQILGVSTDRAAQVLRQLDALSRGDSGVDIHGAGFQRLAASLGRSASQLADQLKQWKISLAGAPSACASDTSAPAPTARLAQTLGVSTERAAQVLRQLHALSHGDRGVDLQGAGFQRLAASLGHSGSQLADLLKQWKISLAGAPGSSCGSKG